MNMALRCLHLLWNAIKTPHSHRLWWDQNKTKLSRFRIGPITDLYSVSVLYVRSFDSVNTDISMLGVSCIHAARLLCIEVSWPLPYTYGVIHSSLLLQHIHVHICIIRSK